MALRAMSGLQCKASAVTKVQLQDFQGTGDFVAMGRLEVGQRDARVAGPDIDHVQGAEAAGFGDGVADRFAVEGHHCIPVEGSVDLAGEAAKRRLRGPAGLECGRCD